MANDKITNLIRVYQNSLKLYDQMEAKYLQKARNDLRDKYISIISDWYNDIYGTPSEPHLYKRKDSLKKAFRIQIVNNQISVEYDSDFMNGYRHRVSNDYIFENSFIQGYHGGADDGEGHPNPGTPYWRKRPNYKKWYKPATQSDSPYELMEEAYPKVIQHVDALFTNEFKRKIYDPLMQAIDDLYE